MLSHVHLSSTLSSEKSRLFINLSLSKFLNSMVLKLSPHKSPFTKRRFIENSVSVWSGLKVRRQISSYGWSVQHDLASIKNIRNLMVFSYTLASEGLTFGVQLVPLALQTLKTQFTQLPCGRLSLSLVLCQNKYVHKFFLLWILVVEAFK